MIILKSFYLKFIFKYMIKLIIQNWIIFFLIIMISIILKKNLVIQKIGNSGFYVNRTQINYFNLAIFFIALKNLKEIYLG